MQNDRDEFFDPVPPPEENGEKERQKKQKRIYAILCVVLAVIFLAVGFFIGWVVRYYSIDEEMRTFLWALDTTEKYYYQEIDRAALFEGADPEKGAKGLIESLNRQVDQYSTFYTLDEFNKVMASGAGQNEGIGVSLFEEKVQGTAYTKVAAVVENSPAQRAGIQKGMYLLAYGSDENNLQSGSSVSAFIGAQKGNFYLKIGFSSDGADAEVISLKREAYQAAYCYYRDNATSYSFRGTGSTLTLTETFSPIEGLDDSTAYIRIDEFSGKASSEFASCLGVMKQRAKTNLVLDIRTNGGGYLNILQEIAAHLLKNAEGDYPLVASAHYKSGKVSNYRAGAKNDYFTYFKEDSKITVLADERTASASECLLGALVDYGTVSYGDIYLRAEEKENGVFGRSYGKGIMQSFYQGQNGVMKLTVATVHWPVTQNCIHGVGVTTDNGAHGIAAPLYWGKEDVMLNAVVRELSGTHAEF